jgi:hypothetical protein
MEEQEELEERVSDVLKDLEHLAELGFGDEAYEAYDVLDERARDLDLDYRQR